MAFNPANFIAVPLLVGIGASFGLQVVARAWEEGAGFGGDCDLHGGDERGGLTGALLVVL